MTGKTATKVPRSLDEWVTYLGEKPLPVLSVTTDKIKSLDPEHGQSTQRLCEYLKIDPGAVVTLLSFVNNLKHSLSSSEITSVENAVKLLGFANSRKILKRLKVISLPVKVPTLRYYLQVVARAYHAGFQAHDWAVVRGENIPGESFIAAFLHNIGEMVMWLFATAEMKKIFALRSQQNIPYKVAQHKVLGFSFVDLSASLCRFWKLPECVNESFESSHRNTVRVHSNLLAVKLARLAEYGWYTEPMRKCQQQFAELHGVEPAIACSRIHQTAIATARHIRIPGIRPAAAMLPDTWCDAEPVIPFMEPEASTLELVDVNESIVMAVPVPAPQEHATTEEPAREEEEQVKETMEVYRKPEPVEEEYTAQTQEPETHEPEIQEQEQEPEVLQDAAADVSEDKVSEPIVIPEVQPALTEATEEAEAAEKETLQIEELQPDAPEPEGNASSELTEPASVTAQPGNELEELASVAVESTPVEEESSGSKTSSVSYSDILELMKNLGFAGQSPKLVIREMIKCLKGMVGFKRVLFCAHDPAARQCRAVQFSDEFARHELEHVCIDLVEQGLFTQIMEESRSVCINAANQAKYWHLVPLLLKGVIATKTFCVASVVVNGELIGYLYADAGAGIDDIPEERFLKFARLAKLMVRNLEA